LRARVLVCVLCETYQQEVLFWWSHRAGTLFVQILLRVCRACCAVCDECFTHPSVCLKCHAHYCSVACRNSDPRHSAAECSTLKEFFARRSEWSEMGSDDETFLLCLLSLLEDKDLAAVSLLSSSSNNTHDPSLGQLLNVAEYVREHACLSLPPLLPDWTSLCQREQNNSFGLFDSGQDALFCFGRAVYARASRFNHACSPNVTRLRAGRDMLFVTRRLTFLCTLIKYCGVEVMHDFYDSLC
jgi:hypothetical protein